MTLKLLMTLELPLEPILRNNLHQLPRFLIQIEKGCLFIEPVISMKEAALYDYFFKLSTFPSD